MIAVALMMYLRRSRNTGIATDWRPTFLAVGLAAIWVIGFVVAMDQLGFVLTATLFVGLLMWYLGSRITVATAISALVAVATYQVFAIHLRVSLPWGFLGW